MHIYALHGFLGLPEDWNILPEHLSCSKVNIYQPELADPLEGLEAWAESFNQIAAKDPRPKALLGYSLGGRLALHALLANPQIWNFGIIISANPGGHTANEKVKRLASDVEWANKFSNDPWELLMSEWNRQNVFASSVSMKRKEQNFDRNLLASSLKGWSLGLQKDLRPKIASLEIPLLWLTGENDATFTSLANGITFGHSHSAKVIVSNAGHRLPWDNPIEFNRKILEFNNFGDK